MQWADSEACWVDLELSLPRKHRLTRQKEIEKVFEEGTFFEGGYCHLIRATAENKHCRAAFIVSKKTAASAVARNRIKRLMKESFRLKINRIKPGSRLIFLATRKANKNLSRANFDRELENLLDRAELFEEIN
jgi:ribonuclease P protein component